jgi:hypothetical protein
MLKIPQLIAETNNEVYVKEKNEDFMTLLSGIMGQKKHPYSYRRCLRPRNKCHKTEFDNNNKQIQALAQVIEDSIVRSYKLLPTNYIAYDILNKATMYADHYTENENLFERRLEMRIDAENPVALQGLLDVC